MTAGPGGDAPRSGIIPGVIADLRSWPRRERYVLGAAVAVVVGSLIFYTHSAYGHGDVTLYHQYAVRFWLGSPPLRTLPAEYPLLALLPFSLTLIPPVPDWVTVFGLWMLALFVAGFVVIRRRESGRAAEVYAITLAVGCFGTLLGRFDLVPAAATVVAYWAARERRFTLAYGLLAVGTLLKLYPALLVPVVVLEQYRSLGLHPLKARPPRDVLRGLAVFCGSVAAVFGASVALSPSGWLGPFTYNAGRPLQVESVPATLLWLSGAFGLPTAPNHSFHSYNLVGLLSVPLSLLADASLVAGCLWVYWQQLTGRISLARALTACLLVIVCAGRVFSPQYLMWVLPLIAITEPELDPLWLAVCAVTTVIFPFAYLVGGLVGPGAPASYQVLFLGLIAVRNGLLLAATGRFLRRSVAGRDGMAAPRIADPTATPAS